MPDARHRKYGTAIESSASSRRPRVVIEKPSEPLAPVYLNERSDDEFVVEPLVIPFTVVVFDVLAIVRRRCAGQPAPHYALKSLSAPVRTGIKKAIRRQLLHEPTKVSKSRIKRLRGLSQPQYRLRVDDIRASRRPGRSAR
jgi:hypothetical protein